MPDGNARASDERFARQRGAVDEPAVTDSLLQALEAERTARRQAARALSRERAAHQRTTQQLERTRGTVEILEQQLQLVAARLEATEAQLAWKSRPVWRKLLGRSPEA